MARTSLTRSGLAIIILLALQSHLFAPTMFVVESRTDLGPPSLPDGDESWTLFDDDVLDYDESLHEAGLSWRRPAGLATVPTLQETVRDYKPSRNNLGLRRIQRRPEDLFGYSTSNKRAPQSRFLNELVARNATTSDQQYLSSAQKRSTESDLVRVKSKNDKNTVERPSNRHQFIYVRSPISNQMLPFQAERFAQGYRNLLPLSDNYKVGLQKMSDSSAPSDNSLESPIESLGLQVGGPSSSTLGCQTTRTLVQLSRDELDQLSGRLMRQCSGSVELNSCEGSCLSGIQPSIKSPTGFAKRCSCCNEAAFRRVQVRLDKCFLVNGNQQQQELIVGAGLVAQPNFMDIEVEEPINCECRQCDSFV